MSGTALLMVALVISLSECGTSDVSETGSGSSGGSGLTEDSDRALIDPSEACISPESDDCMNWLWRKSSSSCECGDNVDNRVLCDKDKQTVGVLQCYCMYNNSKSYYIGSCLYGCFTVNNSNKYTNLYNAYSTREDLNRMCSFSNRQGPLCGQCKDHHSVPAYSFSLKCSECHFRWTNVASYIAVAYGPLTLFFMIIVVFTVGIHSAPLHGYIFVAQMIASSTLLRLLQIMNELHKNAPLIQTYAISFAATVYGIWNLDFFRFINTTRCLHPSLTTLTVMSLDYIIAAYPFIIILLTYILVLLHGRGYRPIVLIWRPFDCVFARFRENLDIRTSLVDAFGTFFSLSYVKFLSTTIDLMAATRTVNVNGHNLDMRVFYDGQLVFMRGKHLHYAVIALTSFLIFSIFPLVFLILYPRRSFQRRIPLGMRRMIHPFMDTLLGIYRDGTDGGYDRRFFVVVYPIARMATFFMLMIILNSFCFLLLTAVMATTAIMVAVIKPYKRRAYNTVDAVLLANLALVFASVTAYFFAASLSKQVLPFTRIMMTVTIFLPFFYACVLTVCRVWTSCKLRRRFIRMAQCVVLCCGSVYFCLVEKSRMRRREMEAFPSFNERTRLIPPSHRDLNN